MSGELLPCPFCGGARLSHEPDIAVSCDTCGATGPVNEGANVDGHSWNIRSAISDHEVDRKPGPPPMENAPAESTGPRLRSWAHTARKLLALLLPDRARGCLCERCLEDEIRHHETAKPEPGPDVSRLLAAIRAAQEQSGESCWTLGDAQVLLGQIDSILLAAIAEHEARTG